MIVKKDGSMETFDRGKIMRGLVVATAKRNVTTESLEALIADVEAELHNTFRYEIPAKALGDMVLMRLRDLDKVAYIRFASVYKSFQDLDEFYEELKHLN